MKVVYKDKYYSADDLALENMSVFLNFGVKEGDLVACMLEGGMSTISIWLTLKRIGAIPVFIPIYFSNDMKQKILDNLRVDFIVESKKEELKVYIQSDRSVLKIERDSVVFTSSASTGYPKIIVRNKEQLKAEFERYKEALKLSETDVFLPMVPLYHAYGFMCSLYAAYMLDAVLVVPHIVFPRTILSLIKKYNVTIIHGVPDLYQSMLSLDGVDLPECLRYIFSSSVSIDDNLLMAFANKFGYIITQQYGSTETGSLGISQLGDSKNEFSLFFRGVDYNLELMEDEQDLCEIIISSPETVGTYVYKNEFKHLDPYNYRTFDYGKKTGERLSVCGRIDDIINCAGKKVSKEYIKNILKDFADLKYIKIEYNENGIIFKYKLHSKENISLFIEFCKKNLPVFALPKEYIWLDNIEETGTWKEGIVWNSITED